MEFTGSVPMKECPPTSLRDAKAGVGPERARAGAVTLPQGVYVPRRLPA
jgi:hypothetical protein